MSLGDAYDPVIDRRLSVIENLLRTGYHGERLIEQATKICDFIEGDKPAAKFVAVMKKRGRPAKPFSSVKPVKRKYTKRSKFWKK